MPTSLLDILKDYPQTSLVRRLRDDLSDPGYTMPSCIDCMDTGQMIIEKLLSSTKRREERKLLTKRIEEYKEFFDKTNNKSSLYFMDEILEYMCPGTYNDRVEAASIALCMDKGKLKALLEFGEDG